MKSAALLALPAATLLACAEDGTPPPEPMWESLVSAQWTLSPGEERTSQLAISTVAEDLAITAIRPLAPVGTHHTLLAEGDASLTSANFLYASGVGTEAVEFPPGVALRLHAGQLLGLQLHIYNTTEAELSGTSGIEVKKMDLAEVEHEVDLFLPGPRNLAIEPGISRASGTCTATQAQTVFAVFPHMHQYGRHLKTTITVGGVATVIHDDAYSFEHQQIKTFTPIQMNPGDTITTECEWDNTTTQTIGYGESSDTEMCYSILFRYPDDGEEFCES